ncbi:MAG: pentapeptide repeat-containing protein, partial [Cyanobacteria bacterium K_Offshore_surface_m2_239]|nr:pentapeptide repeat-containing protein [Cyanobacteria bacterium K_Offshore_surface_m2_239]
MGATGFALRKPAASPAPMARLSQAEVLRRYQAGERDFRGADLRSLRFRGATLAGADFSGADLRGTDFLEADLRGATFVGARFGMPWLRGLFVQGGIGLLVGLVAGSLLAFGITLIYLLLFDGTNSVSGRIGMPLTSIIALILVACQAGFAWEGFSAKGLNFLLLTVAGAFAVAVAVAVAGAGAGAGAGAVAVAVAV